MGKPGTLRQKLQWSLPWLARYPFWRSGELLRRASGKNKTQHLIFVVANHFEPGWSTSGVLDLDTQLTRLEEWCGMARRIGDAVRDFDGTPFQHTNFYPAEQYHPKLLEMLSDLQRDGFGEVEIHLHHGVGQPDNADNLRKVMVEFRDILAHEHGCLSYETGSSKPKYAFVHGNLALANSMGGRCCGVDSEMQILAETGCYADFTLPAAPEQSQVPRINAIYQCAHPLHERAPHRTGPGVRVGTQTKEPVIFTGPLIFDWSRRRAGLPVPRIDAGVIAANYPPTYERLQRWRNASISVSGKPEWIFIKLSCHGFIPEDRDITIGDPMRRFLETALEQADKSGTFKIHFASAREAFNLVQAAVDQQEGEPGAYRDYRLRTRMQTPPRMNENSSLAQPVEMSPQ